MLVRDAGSLVYACRYWLADSLTMWWVQGLTGGIQQGVSEGVVVIGFDRNQTTKVRVEKVQ